MKSGWAAELTTRVAPELCERVPLVPVTLNATLPVGVLALVLTVNVDEAPPAGLGLKLPVVPVGRPLTPRLTEPVKPPVRPTFTVYVVLCPWTAV